MTEQLNWTESLLPLNNTIEDGSFFFFLDFDLYKYNYTIHKRGLQSTLDCILIFLNDYIDPDAPRYGFRYDILY